MRRPSVLFSAPLIASALAASGAASQPPTVADEPPVCVLPFEAPKAVAALRVWPPGMALGAGVPTVELESCPDADGRIRAWATYRSVESTLTGTERIRVLRLSLALAPDTAAPSTADGEAVARLSGFLASMARGASNHAVAGPWLTAHVGGLVLVESADALPSGPRPAPEGWCATVVPEAGPAERLMWCGPHAVRAVPEC